MIKYIKLLLTSLLLLIITACSSYKEYFGGKSYEYQNTKIEKSLESNSKQYPLIKSSRYSIPAVPGEWTGPVNNILPPEEKNNNSFTQNSQTS